MNPEASLKEFETSSFIKKELESLGLEVEKIGQTSLLAIINSKKDGPCKMLRADMDALEIKEKTKHAYKSKNPGLCHACGHDAHMAALLGACKILTNKKDKLNGKLKIIFQAAEEIGRGAKEIIENGVLDDVDLAFGLHVSPSLKLGQIELTSGPRFSSCDIFKIEVFGKSSHIARPELSNDAVLACGSILVNLQAIISRQVSPLDSATISIGKMEAGTRYNIIGEYGYLEGSLRCLDENLRSKLLKKIESTAKLSGQIHGCKVGFTNRNAANVLVNDKDATNSFYKILSEKIGENNLHKDSNPYLIAEDFADYCQKTRGVFAMLGSSSSEETSHPLHNSSFDIDEEVLKIMCQLHLSFALSKI